MNGGDGSVETSANTFVLRSKTETDKAQFSHVAESVQNCIASLNALYSERVRDGEVMSSGDLFETVPGTQVLTPRQYGVLKVNIWDLWQKGLLQSIIQGRPVVFEDDEFSTDPDRVDMRDTPDEKRYISLMYFADEVDIEKKTDNRIEITFQHGRQGIAPTGVVTGDVDNFGANNNAVELRHYIDEGVCIVEPLNNSAEDPLAPSADNTQYPWWLNKPEKDAEKEVIDQLGEFNSVQDGSEAIDDAVEFLLTYETKDADYPIGLPSVLNIFSVYAGIRDTAELRFDNSTVRCEIARLLGLSIYTADVKGIESIVYKSPSQRKRLEELDNAANTVSRTRQTERLKGWMLSRNDSRLDYTVGKELSSEKGLVDVIRYINRGKIDPLKAKYLLVLPYNIDASSPSTVKRDIETAMEIVESVKQFDNKYGTNLYESICLNTWAFRGDVYDKAKFIELIEDEVAVNDTDFWRV